MKTCSSCRESKPESEFGKNLQTPDGLMYYCKHCAASKQRSFRRENPDSAKASRKRYLDKVRDRNLQLRARIAAAKEEALESTLG
jgi:hypothetical protein